MNRRRGSTETTETGARTGTPRRSSPSPSRLRPRRRPRAGRPRSRAGSCRAPRSVEPPRWRWSARASARRTRRRRRRRRRARARRNEKRNRRVSSREPPRRGRLGGFPFPFPFLNRRCPPAAYAKRTDLNTWNVNARRKRSSGQRTREPARSRIPTNRRATNHPRTADPTPWTRRSSPR